MLLGFFRREFTQLAMGTGVGLLVRQQPRARLVSRGAGVVEGVEAVVLLPDRHQTNVACHDRRQLQLVRPKLIERLFRSVLVCRVPVFDHTIAKPRKSLNS